ncbi:uncharacterized protein LOC122282466 [Carya illinoinensis]|uniref:uncharacterized protein LOC122282466 n=1 Tax=Carya illinoinensis TaxID=32201 RepID=UPI001C71A400|nr:uncharacterized protein LOC122282466 [Carya illinoinensis]
MAVFWYFASKFFSPKTEPSHLISNLFHKPEPLVWLIIKDMWLYVYEHEKFNEFGNEQALIWHERNIPYAVWGPESTRSLTLKYYPSEKYGVKRDPETLDIVNTTAMQKHIMVISKIYWGDAREKICEAIDKIPLSCLVIGNRGLSKLKRAILGSVSNYVVNNGSCPVTVVKQVEHEH